ncbi:MAG: hypothetical protein H7306_08255 [Bacteriovorax sp.]|nr:hypothetical protein [Rhizobacter sp.]
MNKVAPTNAGTLQTRPQPDQRPFQFPGRLGAALVAAKTLTLRTSMRHSLVGTAEHQLPLPEEPLDSREERPRTSVKA